MPHRYTGIAPFGLEMKSTTATDLAITSFSDFGFAEHIVEIADRAVISVHGGEAHMTWCNTDPTNTDGILLDPAEFYAVIRGNKNIRDLKFIAESGGPTVTISILLESFRDGPSP